MNATRRAFAQAEIVACLAVVLVLIAVALPLIGAGRSRSRELASLKNLMTIAAAQAAYGADWNDRQYTNMPDTMALSGGSYLSYVNQFGCPPSTVLGNGTQFPGSGSPGLWAYWVPCAASVGLQSNFALLWPMQMGSIGGATMLGFGMFRLQNAVGFNEYVGGRFMDPVFYAPADRLRASLVGPGFESSYPFTFITAADDEKWTSSYIASPAAMFHPGVFGGDADQTFKSPYTFALSSLSPTVGQCAHPDLKSRMTEYAWLQSPPIVAQNAVDTPLLFNHGAASVPMTLFFDGHVSGMPIQQVLSDNEAVVKGGGAKLWMDSDITIGPWAGYEGYYSTFGADETRTSVHVFTRGGILGRDVITPPR